MEPNLPSHVGRPALVDRDPITFDGQRVLTTEMAAKAFKASERQLRDNASANASRFEAGKHYFKIEGAELRALKNSAGFTGSVGANAKSLTLWTERGIARHAKILETDTAWEIFEALEDTYFRVLAKTPQPAREAPVALTASTREARLLHQHFLTLGKLAGLRGNQLLLAANRATKAEIGFDPLGSMNIALIAPVSDPLVVPTKLGIDLGDIAARSVNLLLEMHGYQTQERNHRGKVIWCLTAKGTAAGGQLSDVARSNGTGPAQHLLWPLSMVGVLRGLMSRSPSN